MSVIKELLRAEENGKLSFGNYELDVKSKLADFEYKGDMYKVKTFKEITKMTPMQYIVSLRITNAMNLLDNTNYSISRIASAVGYDNALYFSRLFHKHTGLSPSEYKNRER